MDNLLTKLYYGQIDISNKKPKTERSNEETELFDKLEQSLTKEQFELFQEFLTHYADRYSDYQEYAFCQGVKLGFNLSKELEEFDI